ncbi:hypothetical protein GGX14DRAFT_561787 [Mycena pura]|uniref:Uncharacterized protein n=1 Tax=Mycena pura TaxID=153505 RepID=A0AAD6YEQ6_9AGAR|nr:hypothetical protein GGX14DRAFT_561787 [Mycena pura]
MAPDWYIDMSGGASCVAVYDVRLCTHNHTLCAVRIAVLRALVMVHSTFCSPLTFTSGGHRGQHTVPGYTAACTKGIKINAISTSGSALFYIVLRDTFIKYNVVGNNSFVHSSSFSPLAVCYPPYPAQGTLLLLLPLPEDALGMLWLIGEATSWRLSRKLHAVREIPDRDYIESSLLLTIVERLCAFSLTTRMDVRDQKWRPTTRESCTLAATVQLRRRRQLKLQLDEPSAVQWPLPAKKAAAGGAIRRAVRAWQHRFARARLPRHDVGFAHKPRKHAERQTRVGVPARPLTRGVGSRVHVDRAPSDPFAFLHSHTYPSSRECGGGAGCPQSDAPNSTARAPSVSTCTCLVFFRGGRGSAGACQLARRHGYDPPLTDLGLTTDVAPERGQEQRRGRLNSYGASPAADAASAVGQSPARHPSWRTGLRSLEANGLAKRELWDG